MLGRNAILTALFVLMTGAMAADKPAVEARLRMEGQNQGQTTWVAGGYTAGAIAPTVNGNPAVAYRLAREAQATGTAIPEAAVAMTDEEHPVANVGYHAAAVKQAAQYTAQPGYAANKPAVQYRLDREAQR